MKTFKNIVKGEEKIDEASKGKGSMEGIKYFAKVDQKSAEELRRRYYAIADNMDKFAGLMNSLNGETGEFGADLGNAVKARDAFRKIGLGKFV